MKKTFIAFCLTGVAALVLSGCAATKEYTSALEEATGTDSVSRVTSKVMRNKTTRNDIFRMIGAPSMVFKGANKSECWVYSRVAVRQSELGFQVNGNFSTIFPFSNGTLTRGGGIAGAAVGTAISTNSSNYKTAALLIDFNEMGQVDSYKFTATSF